MKIKLTSLFNIFFRILLIFFVFFIWIRYFFNSLVLSVFLSAFATILFDFIIHAILSKKNISLNLKNEEILKIEQIKKTFIFWNQNQTNTFFFNLFKTKFSATKQSKFIIINKDNKTIALYFSFYFHNLSPDEIVEIYNKSKNSFFDKLIICSSEFDKQCSEIIKFIKSDIVLLNIEKTYFNFLKPYEYYPKDLVNENSIKSTQTLKSLFSNAFCQQKTKGYFFASLILFISSFIIKFNIYYIIMSSLLLILSLLSFLIPKLKHTKTEELL